MTKPLDGVVGQELSRFGFPARDATNRDRMWIAARTGDRATFDELKSDLGPAVTADAHGFVRPDHVDEFVAETWTHAWDNRYWYRRGEAQPLDWVHRIMCDLAAVWVPALGAGNDTAADELACVRGSADLEALLVGKIVDDVLDSLHPCHALILRRRGTLGPDWSTITLEMSYRNERQTKKAHRHAMSSFIARYATVAAPSDTYLMRRGELPPSRRTR